MTCYQNNANTLRTEAHIFRNCGSKEAVGVKCPDPSWSSQVAKEPFSRCRHIVTCVCCPGFGLAALRPLAGRVPGIFGGWSGGDTKQIPGAFRGRQRCCWTWLNKDHHYTTHTHTQRLAEMWTHSAKHCRKKHKIIGKLWITTLTVGRAACRRVAAPTGTWIQSKEKENPQQYQHHCFNCCLLHNSWLHKLNSKLNSKQKWPKADPASLSFFL